MDLLASIVAMYPLIDSVRSCEIAGSQQGSPQQPTLSIVKPEGRPAASVKPGQESCVIKSISDYTLLARSLVKHLEGDEASDWITSGSPM